MRNPLRYMAVAAVAGVLVVATATASFAVVSVDTNRVSRTLLGVGSDTTYEVMGQLDLLYNQSAGCAVLPPVGTTFATFKETCIVNGQLAYSTSYAGLIGGENLYHDRFTEAFPVGSGNGTKILTQFVTSPGTALAADYGRASSKQTYTLPAGTTAYGVAYARNGDGWWLGKTNTFVAHNKLGPTTNATVGQLKNVFVGNASGKCLNTFSNLPNSAFKATFGAPGSGNVAPFATQVGSGSGKDFLSKIDTSTTYSDASALQNCIPAKFKNGDLTDGEHVIQENFAKPICNQTGTPHSWQNRAVFPYGFARFVQNHGGTSGCIGRLQKVNGIAPGPVSIGLTTGPKAYPLTGYVYNYVAVPNGQDVTTPSSWAGNTQSVLSYIDPINGFLCKANTQPDPYTGLSYHTEIANTITRMGFAPLKWSNVGGSTWAGNSYCRDAAAT
jgi:hypothetical protein